jgi:hypothetical protein
VAVEQIKYRSNLDGRNFTFYLWYYFDRATCSIYFYEVDKEENLLKKKKEKRKRITALALTGYLIIDI